MDRRFFWTKVWGAPDVPAHDALAFNYKSTRDDALATILPGDIIVYLTSDATEALPMMCGRVRMLEAAVFKTLASQHQCELSKPCFKTQPVFEGLWETDHNGHSYTTQHR